MSHVASTKIGQLAADLIDQAEGLDHTDGSRTVMLAEAIDDLTLIASPLTWSDPRNVHIRAVIDAIKGLCRYERELAVVAIARPKAA